MPEAEVVDDGERLLDEYIRRYSNWGRWGADDEIGTLNFVGPDEVRQAAGLVRQGRVLSLTLPYDMRGPQSGGFRNNPLLVTTATGLDHLAGAQDPLPWGPAKGFGFSDDIFISPTQAGTQWDALSHIFHRGKMWNGRDAAEVTSRGAAHNGVENLTGRIVTRGVLLDVASSRGVRSLPPGEAVTVGDLDDAAERQGVAIRRGDTVLVRTGFLGDRRDDWGDFAGGPAPGLSLHTAGWLFDHEVAAIATDTWGVEVRPNEIDRFQPLHTVALVHMGMPFGEIFDLDALATDCTHDGIYEFLFVASPLPITGASGSPVSVLAVK